MTRLNKKQSIISKTSPHERDMRVAQPNMQSPAHYEV